MRLNVTKTTKDKIIVDIPTNKKAKGVEIDYDYLVPIYNLVAFEIDKKHIKFK